MRHSISLMILLLELAGVSTWANSTGADYLSDANVVVYGGSYYAYHSKDQDNLHMLYARQWDSDAGSVLYRSEGGLIDVQAPRAGELVGIIERLWEENVSKERATFVDRRYDEKGQLIEVYAAEASILLILNLAGVVVDRIEDVRRYAWNPNGDRIVYITGSYREDRFGFSPTGTWIYDLTSRQAERIYEKGWGVQWESWDGKIYIYDPFNEDAPDTRVYRFDPDTKQLVSTSHQGINFSPAGRYYYIQGYEGAPLRIFETETDSEVPADLSIESADRTRVAGSVRGWLDENTLIVPSPDPNEDGDYLYDIETGKLRYATGAVLPERGLDDRVLVLEGANVIGRTLDEFEITKEGRPLAVSGQEGE